MKKFITLAIGAVIVLGILVAGAAWYTHRESDSSAFQTTPLKRGDLQAVISATGTIEPEEVVDVGAQVAGRIANFGNDPSGKLVDYGSNVEQGTVLAIIDDALYAADEAAAQASVEAAKANVNKSKADLVQMQAKFNQAKADWDRAQKIGESEALAQSAFDGYRYGFDTAKANVGVAEAEQESSEKAVAQVQATLDRAKTNHQYCTIVSPVKGTIIDRRVNIGQTVVSSLSAPSLFLIAKDLKKMQVWASVNEADIANIRSGQDVAFTVDAHPDRTFKGNVNKVRLNASMTQNVVTYTVEVNVDNSDSTLLPYQTANVSFQVDKRQDVMMVPNAALRWAPSQTEQISPDFRNSAAAGGGHKHGGDATSDKPAAAGATPTTNPTTKPAGHKGRDRSAEQHRGTVWIEDGEFVKPIAVKLGLTDGQNTEVQPVQGDDLKEGIAVVTGEARPSDSSGGGEKNPFAPQMSSHKHSH